MDKKGLGEIQQEIERLKARVGKLEEKLGIGPGEDEKVLAQEKAQALESKELKPTPESLEEKIGGTWLNRFGIVALLVGLGLAFAKLGYASRYRLDHNHGRLWFCSGGNRIVAQI